MFLHLARLLAAVLACLLVGAAAPAHADHRPNHHGGGHERPDKPGKPGKPDDPGRPDDPGKPGDNYSASLLTTVDVVVQGATVGTVAADDSVVVLVEVLSDALGDAGGALTLDGLVQLRADDTLLGTQRVRDGAATFEVPAEQLGVGDVDLIASFVPDDGTHFAASETTEAVTVGQCDECTDDQVSLASADQLPAQGDRAWPWMGLALVVLLAGGALLWLLAGGPMRQSVRRR